MDNKIKLKKRIVKIGDSYAIILDRILIDSNGWQVGDLLDISDIVKVKENKDGDS